MTITIGVIIVLSSVILFLSYKLFTKNVDYKILSAESRYRLNSVITLEKSLNQLKEIVKTYQNAGINIEVVDTLSASRLIYERSSDLYELGKTGELTHEILEKDYEQIVQSLKALISGVEEKEGMKDFNNYLKIAIAAANNHIIKVLYQYVEASETKKNIEALKEVLKDNNITLSEKNEDLLSVVNNKMAFDLFVLLLPAIHEELGSHEEITNKIKEKLESKVKE